MLERMREWIRKKTNELNSQILASPTLQDLQAYLSHHTLGDILPYRLYDEVEGLYINHESLGLVFEGALLIGATDQTIDLLANVINHVLPEGASCQFLLYASPNVEPYLNRWADCRTRQGKEFSLLAQERVAFLKQGAWGSLLQHGDFPIRHFRCFFSVTLADKTTREAVGSLKASLKRAFKSLPISLNDLPPESLIQLVCELFYPSLTGTPRVTHWRSDEFINRQCSMHETSTQVTAAGLQVNEGQQEIRVYSVSRFPESWPQWAMQNLIGDLFLETQRLACPFFFSLSVHIPNQSKEAGKTAVKSMRAERLVNSPAVKYVPEIVKIAQERRFITALLNKKERLVKLSFQMGLISPTNQSVKNELVLENLLVSQGWHLYRHRYVHAPLLYACFPMVQDKALFNSLQRLGVVHTQTGQVVANIAPLQGESSGMSFPCLLLTGRRGQLMWFDPFANDTGNYNVCITGKSGSGKSFFMQELAVSIVGAGGRAWIIDVGRSYEKTCRLLGGEFIEFTLDKAISLNPFTHIQVLDEDHLALLKPIIEQMVAPNDLLADVDRVILEQALQQTWECYGQQNTISHLANWLLSQQDSRAQECGRRLYPYTQEGMYGRYFNSPATINFDNPFLVMELEELKNKGDMQSIVLMLIMFHITQAIYQGDRKTRTACFIDEAWQLLRGEKIKDFIENMARRARKYNASLITGTQSIQDYFDNPAAQAVYNNSDYTVILSQLPQTIEQLKREDKFPLDPHKERLIKSLTMRAGEYADVFIQGPQWYAVAQLILDDFTLALYSTKGEEFHRVQQLQNEGYSLVEAIRIVAKEKFHAR